MIAMHDNRIRFLWIAALTVFGFSLCWSVRNILVLPDETRKLSAGIGTLEQLQKLQAEQCRYHGQMAPIKGLKPPVRAGASLDLFVGIELNAKPEIIEKGVQSLPDGWRVRQVEIRIPELELTLLDKILSAAAVRRPPWVLQTCNISALSEQPGIGRIILQMATLEKD